MNKIIPLFLIILMLSTTIALATDQPQIIIKEHEFTTDNTDFNYDAPMEIIENNITYQRKNIEYEVVKETPQSTTKTKMFEVELEEQGLKEKDDSVFDNVVEINEDGFIGEIPLKEVIYKDRSISGRTANHKVEYDYGLQVRVPKPQPALDVVYHDDETNNDILVTLSFDKLKETVKPHWEHNIHVYQTYRSIYEDEYLLIDGTRLSFSSEKPQYKGIEEKILKQMRLDPERYIISDSVWVSKGIIEDGIKSRLANFIVKRYVTGYAAIYSGTFDIPDIIVYDAMAIYESELSKKVPSGIEYTVKAIVTYKEVINKIPKKTNNVGVIVGTSTGVIALCGLIFLLIKRKKKNNKCN